MNFREAIEYLKENEINRVKDDEGNIYDTYCDDVIMNGRVVCINDDYITPEHILQMLDSEFEVLKWILGKQLNIWKKMKSTE